MTDLRDLTIEEMCELAVRAGQPKFRGRQLYDWVYKGKINFREMSNLPEVFLRYLEENCSIDPLKMIVRQKSKIDGTQKFLFGLADGNAVESVLMEYKYGASVCISSQAGCRMGCAFCASGNNGLERNLTAGEMMSEVMDISKETGKNVSHVVVMGTGEPFDNYENLSKFIRLINNPKGLNLGMRNITVSTCGLVPGIRNFAKDFPQVNLAVSLHAPNDELRKSIMPVARKYGIEELMSACKEYIESTNRRITFEYSLIRDVNDTPESIDELIKLLRGMLCHVNLIPLNAVSETGFDTSGRDRAKEIMNYLNSKGIVATVRRQLGADINGACGQLRSENSKNN